MPVAMLAEAKLGAAAPKMPSRKSLKAARTSALNCCTESAGLFRFALVAEMSSNSRAKQWDASTRPSLVKKHDGGPRSAPGGKKHMALKITVWCRGRQRTEGALELLLGFGWKCEDCVHVDADRVGV